jgi:hypothetical protein
MAQSPSGFLQCGSPRIAAIELARYMTATDKAKLGIIRRAKESVTFGRARYADARKTIQAFLGNNARPRTLLHAARDRYKHRLKDARLGPYSREEARLSIDALDSFARMQNQFGGMAFRPAPARAASLLLSEVEVSVNVDLLVGGDRNDDQQIGGALFRFNKAEDETNNAAGRRRDLGLYAATLVYMHVERNLAGNQRPHYQLCMSVDVQAKEIHYVPPSYAQRVANLENACTFIRAIWNLV